MTRSAIVIVTYNRLAVLKETLARVKEFTEGSYDLIVADDGSSDGSADYCRELGIRVVTGPNRGIAGNKNRGLYAAMHYTPAEVIFLLEDDCWPDTQGWNTAWEAMTMRWNHVCYGPVKTWPPEYIHGGDGSVEDPFRSKYLTAQIIGVTRQAVERVGYLSPHFRGYGHEHAEWTFRFAHHGYFAMYDFVCCNSGLTLADAGTFYTKEDVENNGRIMNRLAAAHHKKRFQAPWKHYFDRRKFLAEIRNSLGDKKP
jgi:glycosyltransferase involved in cell wall biosynthesis